MVARLQRFILGEEEKLLLRPIDAGFERFLKVIKPFIVEISKEVS